MGAGGPKRPLWVRIGKEGYVVQVGVILPAGIEDGRVSYVWLG